jgi:peptide/nickel transport system substrate-binding protein
MSSDFWARTRVSARLNRRRLLAGGAAATGTALLAGCGAKPAKTGSTGAASVSGTAGAIKRGGTLTTFITSPSSEDLEPHGVRSESASTQPMLALVYNGLLRLKLGSQYSFTDRSVEGVLATKWEQPDPQTLVFHLRPGVKFHDKPPVNGRELAASDVKFSFERMTSSPFAYLNFFSSIASIETQDAQTVTFKLKSPDAALLGHLGTGFAWVIAKEAGKADAKGAAGLSFKEASTAIGTGPFMLDSYQHESKASFVRNPNYFEPGLPYLDRVDFQVIGDTSAQVAAMQTGQVTVGNLPLGSEADFKSRNPKLVFTAEPTTQAWHKAMRTDKPPFNDVRVRRAIAMAYDQESVKKIWGVSDSPSSYGSLTSIAGDAYLPLNQLGDSAQWWKLDVNAAKQLLAGAGFPNGFSVDYNDSTCCGPQELPEQAAADLAKIGIKLNIKIKEHAAYQATTLLGQYEGTAGNQVPVYDPGDWFNLAMLSSSVRDISHVDDPTINDLTAKQKLELDTNKRIDILHQLVRYCADQVYYVVEPQAVVTEVRQPYLKNYAPRLGYQPTYTVAWLDK